MPPAGGPGGGRPLDDPPCLAPGEGHQPGRQRQKLPAAAKTTVDRYRELYKVDIQDQAGYSLSAAAALVDSLERATAMDRAAIWDSVKKVNISLGKNPFVVIPYGVKWDDKGDNDKAQAVMTQILDQKLVVVYPKDLAAKPAVIPPPKWEERA